MAGNETREVAWPYDEGVLFYQDSARVSPRNLYKEEPLCVVRFDYSLNGDWCSSKRESSFPPSPLLSFHGLVYFPSAIHSPPPIWNILSSFIGQQPPKNFSYLYQLEKMWKKKKQTDFLSHRICPKAALPGLAWWLYSVLCFFCLSAPIPLLWLLSS